MIEGDKFVEHLSTRARNCLKGRGIYTREGVIAAINDSSIRKIPGLGKESLLEICVALDLPIPRSHGRLMAISQAIRFLEREGYEVTKKVASTNDAR